MNLKRDAESSWEWRKREKKKEKKALTAFLFQILGFYETIENEQFEQF